MRVIFMDTDGMYVSLLSIQVYMCLYTTDTSEHAVNHFCMLTTNLQVNGIFIL